MVFAESGDFGSCHEDIENVFLEVAHQHVEQAAVGGCGVACGVLVDVNQLVGAGSYHLLQRHFLYSHFGLHICLFHTS